MLLANKGNSSVSKVEEQINALFSEKGINTLKKDSEGYYIEFKGIFEKGHTIENNYRFRVVIHPEVLPHLSSKLEANGEYYFQMLNNTIFANLTGNGVITSSFRGSTHTIELKLEGDVPVLVLYDKLADLTENALADSNRKARPDVYPLKKVNSEQGFDTVRAQKENFYQLHSAKKAVVEAEKLPDSDYASELLKQMVVDTPNSNIVIPTLTLQNIMMQLALSAGKESQARKQVLDVLGVKVESKDSEAVLREIILALEAAHLSGDGNNNPLMTVKNAMFVNPRFEKSVSLMMKEIITNELKGKVIPATENDLQTINKWVRTTTKGKIKSILDQLNPNMMVVLASTMLFEGQWKNKFKTITEGIFKSSEEQHTKVDMLSGTAQRSYAENEKIQMVDMAFQGNDNYVLRLYVPKKGHSLNDVLALTKQQKLELTGSAKDKNVELTAPRFSIEWKSGNLIENLKQLGIYELFKEGSLTNLFGKQNEAYISQIKATGFAEFGPSGFKAGGGVAAENSLRSSTEPQATILADHPFMIELVQKTKKGDKVQLQALVQTVEGEPVAVDS